MARKLLYSVSSRLDTAKVKNIPVSSPVRLVTFEDPEDDTTLASGAFVRIKPPEGLSEAKTSSWANLVRKKAIAVKVLTTPKAADVPADASRVDEDEEVGTFREEAMRLAKETENEGVLKFTKEILDDCGIR